MIHQTPKPLKILNASAGSGKTYHLVKAYIELLISEEKTGSSFANVIAMTFTNKAALEMKERIIAALDQISSPKIYKNKALQLTTDIADGLGLTTIDVQNRCRRVLGNILHQYEEFHIMTIDKFNLRLIKSFGRDLDLPNDFEVVLDETEIIEKIVDDILNQLGEEGSESLNKLILSYAKANIDEGNQWNFRRNLVDFGKILRNEKNNKIIEQLMEMDFSTEQFGLLINARTKIDQSFLTLIGAIQNEINSCGIDPSLLPGKTVTFNAIKKVLAYDKFHNNADLFSPTFLKNLEVELKPNQDYPQGIKDQIYALIYFWENKLKEYASLELFLKNFFNMALLQFMATSLKKVRKDEQLIRISEFNALISELIQNEHTPFIYERLGSKFHHFLLDEFQDTSRLQWLNLVPLVKESMSQNHVNLIVGDPKQSIYRFKNGIAEQFVSLPQIYNPENDPHIASQSAYFDQMGELSELESNWRSSSTIVKLNNSFFTSLRNMLPEKAAEFYNSVIQNPQSKSKGKVHIISKEEKKSPDELVPQIIEWIEECKTDGFKPGEICILGGTNKECNRWALGLTSHGYKVVSTDSLLINSSLKVQLTIAFLHRRLNPSGENEMKRFAELFFRIKSGSFDEYQSYIVEKITESGKKYRRFNDQRFLSDHFGGEIKFFFKHENLYDLVQQFYSIAGYNELNDPYLHHLADLTFDYGLSKGPDLRSFLGEYELKKNKIAVQIPESDESIQLMTIHKSKGLEFPVVIVPTMNFKNEVKSHFLIHLDDYVIYKQPTSKDHLEVLKELYNAEKTQVIVDNVNKCYVAMTRPVERLYIANFFEKNKFGQLFHDTLEESEDSKLIDDFLVLEYDDGIRTQPKSSLNESSLFIPKNASDRLWFPDISLQDNDILLDTDYLSEEMQFGIQFHYLASILEDKSEIKAQLNKSISEGEVSQSNAKELELKLNDLFENPQYAGLFESKKEVLNEQAIIVDDTTTLIPDKIIIKEDRTIIIDYKTGLPGNKDIKQIKSYQHVLESMSFPQVSCYLYYSSLGELRHIG
ncbi:MAG: UvrD-helicase domain-containing protein [Crocinitomicaceae bacterium]|nr:UvrD-helicase domain-containing protein [Crocinitomicaceae bacterium]